MEKNLNNSINKEKVNNNSDKIRKVNIKEKIKLFEQNKDNYTNNNNKKNTKFQLGLFSNEPPK